ncbi:MBL fold metallo-hydrolase [Pyrococcus sp. ST04]|uniref:MBL fold metallo-hydrolase n=1 Tax=Pyrococcus sp. ST04 TaxID=1183377 RepID=UPI0002606027|nr:MBL fold metallo-hydrolase [Pyrococcus sp. ST04]AFK22779.1 putative metallo-beta-lactamase superfamily hydrolase [Pyrococcus sp. ST04]
MVRVVIVFENHAGYRKGLIGYHGFSALVENNGYRVLVDTGTDGNILLNNMRELGINPDSIDALFITHGHYDHTGGLKALLEAREKPLDIYAHPQIFEKRIALKPRRRDIGIPFEREELEELGAVFHLSEKPKEFLPGFLSSGEIERTTWDRAVGYFPDGRRDPVKDDMALIVDAGDGLVVISGCGHSGIINIARHAIRIANKRIAALIGGFHLKGASREILEDVVDEMKKLEVERLYPGHCTGIREFAYLYSKLGNVEEIYVGKEIKI